MSSYPPPPQDPGPDGPHGRNQGYGGPNDPYGGAQGPGGGTGPQDPGPGGRPGEGDYGHPGGSGEPPRYSGGPNDPYGGGHGGAGEPGGYGGPPRSPRNGFGIAALILGIVGVLLFWTAVGGVLLGLLAVVFGILGWRRSKRGEATNGGMSIAGLVLGALALIGSIIVIVAGVALFNSEEFSNFTDCVEQAETQSEIEDCEQEFNEQFNG
ncbi:MULTISPECIES: DUF4190 domain-containing protein [Streptomyces]|uniref:DUF4190 domain-containing protein n=1 Tax=Streptomyces TaxID=1883 RepID=UPI0022491E76|nr:DUF4190 domain-containing protein [Streptomyces sp. JHD 1]MCX2967422.1 DUF4190 domain-containing protein [Streptomyces sp. JHD 1]